MICILASYNANIKELDPSIRPYVRWNEAEFNRIDYFELNNELWKEVKRRRDERECNRCGIESVTRQVIDGQLYVQRRRAGKIIATTKEPAARPYNNSLLDPEVRFVHFKNTLAEGEVGICKNCRDELFPKLSVS